MSKKDLNAVDLNVEEVVENDGTEKPKAKLNFFSIILILVGIICIGVSAWGLYGIYTEYQVAVDRYNELENEFVEIYTPPVNTEDDTDSTEDAPQVPWYQMISVNLEGLQKKYPDIVGWIFFENETISYPVLHAEDNDKYLRTTYDGKSATAGSIFIEATHSGDFSDTHTIVYGHNMKNLSMFGKLKYYKTQDGYYDTHQYFQIFSGNKIMRYQIFAYQEVGVDSFVYQEAFTSGRVLANKLVANSMVNPRLDIKDNDKIITLSTCTTEDEYRFVVSAVLVETYTIGQ